MYGTRNLRLRRTRVKGLLWLVGCYLSLGCSLLVLFILRPAQGESKGKAEMLGGSHYTLHIHLSPCPENPLVVSKGD